MKRVMLVVLALEALVAVPVVHAAELTRDEYVARVEPICKKNTEVNKRIFAGANEEVKKGKTKPASTHFMRARTALDKTVGQLEAVPRPAVDEAKLGRWISHLEIESAYIGRALAQAQKGKAQTLSVQLNRNSKLANDAVLAFGFNYCRLDPSRFT